MTELIDHGPGCTRPAPVLRLSWLNEPEIQCPKCGRYAPAPDSREGVKHEKHTIRPVADAPT